MAWAVLATSLVVGCGPAQVQAPNPTTNVEPGPPLSVCGPPLAADTVPADAKLVIDVGHAGPVTHLAFSDDGRLASWSQFDRSIRFWDTKRRALLQVQPSPEAVLWDPEAKMFVSAPGLSFDPKCGLYTSAGEPRGERPQSLSDIAVLQDGALRFGWIVGSDNPGGKDLKLPGGSPIRLPGFPTMVDGHPTLVRGARELVVVGLGGELHRWDLTKSPATKTVTKLGEVKLSAIHDDGWVVVVEGIDETEFLGWRVSRYPGDPSGKPQTLLESDSLDEPTGLVISSDGHQIVVASNEGLFAYDTSTAKPLWSEAGERFRGTGFSQGRGFFALASDGKTVAAARFDGTIALRDIVTGRKLGSLGTSVVNPETVAWLDDDHLVEASHSLLSVWNVADATRSASYAEREGFLSVGVSGGDVLMARRAFCLSTPGGAVAWWGRWEAGEPPPGLLRGDVPDLEEGCFLRPGPTEAIRRGGGAKTFRLDGAYGFDVTSGRALVQGNPTFLGKPDSIRDVVTDSVIGLEGFSLPPGAEMPLLRGRFLLSNRSDAVGVWDATTGKKLQDLTVQTRQWDGTTSNKGRLVGMSQSGDRVAIRNGADVGIFALATGTKTKSFTLESDIPLSVALGERDEIFVTTLKGSLFAIASDGSSRKLDDFPPFDDGGIESVQRLSLSPGGKRLAVLGTDGGMRIVDPKTGATGATLVLFADDEPLAFTPTGHYVGSREAAERVHIRFDAPLDTYRFEQFASSLQSAERVRASLQRAESGAAAKLSRPPGLEFVGQPRVDGSTAKLSVKFDTARRVDYVRAFREGREVATASPCSPSGEVELEVPLLPGQNAIALQAFDDRGAASNSTSIEIAGPPGQSSDVWLVAVGVGQYPKLPPSFRLERTVADAQGMAGLVDSWTGKGKTFREGHKTVLLDEKATVQDILSGLDGLASMRPDDLAIVFFAGHGVTVGDDMVFLTHSAGSSDDELRAGGVSWADVASRLAKAKGRVLVLLDACHSGQFGQDLIIPNDRLASALARDSRVGVLVFAAAKGRQSSYEPTGARAVKRTKLAPKAVPLGTEHGYFTGALLQAATDPKTDRNGDGSLQISEWIDVVTESVTVATDGLQTPWVARREFMGDFTVAPTR